MSLVCEVRYLSASADVPAGWRQPDLRVGEGVSAQVVIPSLWEGGWTFHETEATALTVGSAFTDEGFALPGDSELSLKGSGGGRARIQPQPSFLPSSLHLSFFSFHLSWKERKNTANYSCLSFHRGSGCKCGIGESLTLLFFFLCPPPKSLTLLTKREMRCVYGAGSWSIARHVPISSHYMDSGYLFHLTL